MRHPSPAGPRGYVVAVGDSAGNQDDPASAFAPIDGEGAAVHSPPPVDAPAGGEASSPADGAYVVVDGVPTPQRSAARLGGLVTAATVLLGIVSALSLVAAVLNFRLAGVAQQFADGDASLFDLIDAENLMLGVNRAVLITSIPTIIVWIVWQFRFSRNAQLFGRRLGLGPGWAIGGWFIPLVNFGLPAVQMWGVAKASDPDLPDGAPADDGRAPRVLVPWAITWALSVIVTISGSGTRGSENTTLLSQGAFTDYIENDYVPGSQTIAVGLLLYAAAGVLGLLLIRRMSDAQNTSLRQLGRIA